MCSIHMVNLTTGRAGLRLQRAEEVELCRGCHRITIYCNGRDSEGTADWCQSNLMWGSQIQTLRKARGAPLTVTAHPDASWGKTRQQAKLAPLNHSEQVCQQVVSSHKSSNALTLSAGRFLRGPVPPPLTQIGNVTHPQENWSSKRDRELTVTTLDGAISKTTGSELRLGSHGILDWLHGIRWVKMNWRQWKKWQAGVLFPALCSSQRKSINSVWVMAESDNQQWQGWFPSKHNRNQLYNPNVNCREVDMRAEPGERCGTTGCCPVSPQCYNVCNLIFVNFIYD